MIKTILNGEGTCSNQSFGFAIYSSILKKDISYSFVNLSHSTKKINGEITISGSKSESNRLLILS